MQVGLVNFTCPQVKAAVLFNAEPCAQIDTTNTQIFCYRYGTQTKTNTLCGQLMLITVINLNKQRGTHHFYR